MAKSKQWVVCSKCDTLDASRKPSYGYGTGRIMHPAHAGTAVTMRCPDCCTPPGTTAAMCRNCCPTGHATRVGATSLDDMIAAGTARRGKDCYEGLAADGEWVQIGNDREDAERYLEAHTTPDTW